MLSVEHMHLFIDACFYGQPRGLITFSVLSYIDGFNQDYITL